MSDENGRGDRVRHDRETDEFGGPLFPESGGTRHDRPTESVEEVGSGPISFGPNDTGSLPHWTDPPTGEIPRVEPTADPSGELDEEIDVWSSFTSESPVWREDIAEGADSTGQIPTPDVSGSFGLSDPSGGFDRPRDPSGGIDRPRDPSGQVRRTDPSGPIPAERREPARIQIGTDPSGIQRRPAQPAGRSRGTGGKRRAAPPASGARRATPTTNRDLPAAIIAAVVLAAAFIAATLWRPVAVLAIVVVVLAVAAYEYFSKVTEKGYRPVVAAGVLACVAAPLAAYWMGEDAIPLVIAFAFMAAAISFVGASGVESGPLPNMAITTMGIVWIGLLGSFAALILRWSTAGGADNSVGTDTLFLVVLGVAANDIGALFIGSSAGKTPLRQWISPGKTLEGLIGGTVLTVIALVVVGITDTSTTWNDTPELLALALVISVMAPLGDLTESMFKRNLDVKDFGSIVAGHGGVLDRFDGFLFALPAVYYLGRVLEPWLSS